jgi:hypothetical protein
MRPDNWDRFSFGDRLESAAMRVHKNKLDTTLANKLVHISWSVLRHGRAFDSHGEAAAI